MKEATRKLTAGDMPYIALRDKFLKLMGFWKLPIYCFFTGAYLGYKWEWLGWREEKS